MKNLLNNTRQSINILGSCVIRDTFGFSENDGGYKINQYVNGFSPIFSLHNNLDLKFDHFNNLFLEYKKLYPNMPNLNSFWARCKFLELSGNVINYLNEKPSDFLIIDVAVIRYNYDMLENGKFVCKYIDSFIEFLSNRGIIPRTLLKNITFDQIDNIFFRKRINFFLDSIKNIIKTNRIIVLNNSAARFAINKKEQKIKLFNQDYIEKINKRYNLYFKIIKESLEGCHVIDFQPFLIGDLYHKWGPSPLHYTKETYDFLLKCFDKIIKEPEINHFENIEKSKNEFFQEQLNHYKAILPSNFIN